MPVHVLDAPTSGAVFSGDRVYRYALWREWDAGAPRMAVIGLNPSTADETVDDPTIRRCIGFAKREGCGGLVMLNLFALRATDPKVMKAHPMPIGPDNDEAIVTHGRSAAIVVVAWGAHGSYRAPGEPTDRETQVLWTLGRWVGRDKVRSFGLTKGGHPRHPLYLSGAAPLVAYGGQRVVGDGLRSHHEQT